MKDRGRAPWLLLITTNIVLAAFCGTEAVLQAHGWLSVFNAFVAGVTLCGAVYSLLLMRQQRAFDTVCASFEAREMLNDAIIEQQRAMIERQQRAMIGDTDISGNDRSIH